MVPRDQRKRPKVRAAKAPDWGKPGIFGLSSTQPRANRLKLLGITYLVGKIKFRLLFHGPLAEWVVVFLSRIKNREQIRHFSKTWHVKRERWFPNFCFVPEIKGAWDMDMFLALWMPSCDINSWEKRVKVVGNPMGFSYIHSKSISDALKLGASKENVRTSQDNTHQQGFFTDNLCFFVIYIYTPVN